jgi:hypothetical protein
MLRSRFALAALVILIAAALTVPAFAGTIDWKEPKDYDSYGENNSGAAVAPFKFSLKNPIVDNLPAWNKARKSGVYTRYGAGWAGPCGCEPYDVISHANGYAGCYDYITNSACGNSQDGDEWAKWTPAIRYPGTYEVWISFVCTENRANPAIYEVHHADGVDYFKVVQNVFGCGMHEVPGSQLVWAYLGDYRFNAGKPRGFVKLVNSDVSGHSDCADAAGFKLKKLARFAVSGTVSTAGETPAPLAGVTITYPLGSGDKEVTTGEDGTYSFRVPFGWAGTLTPSLEGHTFDPSSIEVEKITGPLPDQDFTATPDTP